MTKKNQIKLPRSVKRLFPNVTFAYDSNQAIEISVNNKDCSDAKRKDSANCALARAAKRELKADGAIIGLSSSYIIRGAKAIRFATPEAVQREIVSFDRNQNFEPGEYRLVPKSPTNRLGQIRNRKVGGKNKNATRKIHHSVNVRVLPRGVSK